MGSAPATRLYSVLAAIVISSLFMLSSLSFYTVPAGGSEPYARAEPVIDFTNVTDAVGLSGVRGDSYAWGDYNNDGYQDLLVKGARLFRNSGPPYWYFTEVTELVGIDAAGYAVWGDYNNDGYLDFYAAGHPLNNSMGHPDRYMDTLWRNNGPPSWTFTNATKEAGSPDDGYPSIAAGWGDYDRDGYLDIYVVNWRDLNDVRYPDTLWHNNGDGTFTDMTVKAGIDDYTEPYAGMGVNWGDYNDDGWLDIYVSNYLLTPNYLWHNNGDGTFYNAAFEAGVTGEESVRPPNRYYGHTAGSAWADFDNDGDLDLWQTNLAHKDPLRAGICADSELLRNDGPTAGYTFTNIRDTTGIPTQPPGGNEELFFGCAWGDYDNDGDLDIWVPQIKNYIDYAYSYFFRNNGDGTFTDVSEETGIRVWDTDGGAWCDYNNDGWIDLIAEGKVPYENGTYEVRLFRNNAGDVYAKGERSWLSVKLDGMNGNPSAIGARVTVTDGTGRTQMREVEGGSAGHSYQHSLPVEFGFGTYSGNVDVTVRWPKGRSVEFNGVGINRHMKIEEPEGYPDLVISELRPSIEEPHEGAVVTLSAKVENWGKAPAEEFRVRFFDGAAPEELDDSDLTAEPIGEPQWVYETLDAGRSKTVSVKWNTEGKAGDHTIWAWADQVQPLESNEDNNDRIIGITVRPPNTPPVPVLKAASLTAELPEAIITFDASDSYDDGTVTGFNFAYGDGEVSGWADAPEVSYRYTKAGEYTASLIVRDDTGAVSEEQAFLTVTIKDPEVNEPPRILDIIIPGDVYISFFTGIEVIAEDPNDDIVEYTFTAEAGTIITRDNIATWGTPDEPGTYDIEITVIDSAGNYDKDTISVDVIRMPIEVKSDLTVYSSTYPDDIKAGSGDASRLEISIRWYNPFAGTGESIMGSDVEAVVADMSAFDGGTAEKLNDRGKSGDEEADDGYYSLEFYVGSDIKKGTYTVPVTITLADGRVLTEDVKIYTQKADETDDGGPLGSLPGFDAAIAVAAVTLMALMNTRRKKDLKDLSSI